MKLLQLRYEAVVTAIPRCCPLRIFVGGKFKFQLFFSFTKTKMLSKIFKRKASRKKLTSNLDSRKDLIKWRNLDIGATLVFYNPRNMVFSPEWDSTYFNLTTLLTCSQLALLPLYSKPTQQSLIYI